MWPKLAITVAAAVSLGVAAMPTGVMAAHGGGGHGGGGHGGFSGGGFSGARSFSGARTFSAPGNFSRGVSVNRGAGVQSSVNRSVTNANRTITSAPLEGRRVTGNGQWAWIGGHRHHGRHIHGFIPGFGYGWYWYYDDCYVLTDYGWINICGDDY